MNTKNDVKAIIKAGGLKLPKELVTDVSSSSLASVYMMDVIQNFHGLVTVMDQGSTDAIGYWAAHLKFSLEALELSLGVDAKATWLQVVNEYKHFGK